MSPVKERGIDAEILQIIRSLSITGNEIRIGQQLDPKTYKKINQILEEMGGKWNRGRKAHLFQSDPTTLFTDLINTRSIAMARDNGYFPTPRDLALRVVDLAEIHPGMRVLEPSAGRGALVDAIFEREPRANVTCVEILMKNQSALVARYIEDDRVTLILHDFLDCEFNAPVDRVVMNPPFENKADIDHVTHAWRFVKPGGRLVSIMSASILSNMDHKTVDFRTRWLDRFRFHVETNPPDAFKESGTLVRTVTVVMEKE